MPDENARRGDMPTSGAQRPGPAGPGSDASASESARSGVKPIAIRIPSIGVDTQTEIRLVVNGVMANPTGPWVIAWYPKFGWLNESAANVVMAGHVDYAGVGPAVLARAGELTAGDGIDVTGYDRKLYQYIVESSQLVDEATAPVEQIVASSDDRTLTLITCGGTFDSAAQRYLQRLIIRAIAKS